MNRKERRQISHNSKKLNGLGRKHTKGVFGKGPKFLGEYKTLKVVPKGMRNPISCNDFGILVP